MKKLVALIIAAALCMGMFSVTAYAGEDAGEGYKVGVILYDTECQWAKDIMGCLRAIGEPLGVTFESVIGGTDPATVMKDFPFIGTLLKKNQDIDAFNSVKRKGYRF